MKQSKWVEAPIVCGVDGSAPSRLALRAAARLARAMDARLEVVMVWQASTSLYDVQFPDPGRAPKVVALGVLQEVVDEEFGDEVPDWVRLRAIPGTPGEALVEDAAGAAMLVVGCRGRTAAAAPFLGSVSLYCASAALCPVLIVRSP